MDLRAKTIRLAYENPDLRPHLVPLLSKEARGTMVAVKDLPPVLQRALKEVSYGKRDIEIEAKSSVSVQGAGGDGYQEFAVILNLETGESKTLMGSWGGANPFSPRNQVDLDDRQHAIPMNGAVIKGTRGGGRPVYATIYLNPGNMNTLLAPPVDLTPQEDVALAIIGAIKPAYRGDSFSRKGLGQYVAGNPLIKSLEAKGLVKTTGAGIQITTAGKNAVNRSIRV